MKKIITLLQCIFCWEVHPSNLSEMEKARVILAQGFGQGAEGTPGISNEAIASIVKDLYHQYPLPIVAQWEIAEALKKIGVECDHIVYKKTQRYLNTHSVLEESWRFCQPRGLKKAFILAHPDHLWRCTKTAEKFGFEVVIPDNHQSIPYDKNSTQKWTRTEWCFKSYELFCARPGFLLKGWI